MKFTRVNEIETMYERRRVNVKLSARGSTFTFTRDLTACIVSILVTPVKVTLHWKSTLRNGPYQLTSNSFDFDTALETEFLYNSSYNARPYSQCLGNFYNLRFFVLFDKPSQPKLSSLPAHISIILCALSFLTLEG